LELEYPNKEEKVLKVLLILILYITRILVKSVAILCRDNIFEDANQY